MARQEPTILVRRVLWGSIGTSIASLGIGLPWLLPAGTGDLTALAFPMLTAAVGSAGAALFLARRPGFHLWVVALCLAEVPAILGLVAHLIGGGDTLRFVLPALAAWGLSAPRKAPADSGTRATVDLPPPLS